MSYCERKVRGREEKFPKPKEKFAKCDQTGHKKGRASRQIQHGLRHNHALPEYFDESVAPQEIKGL